MQHWNEDDGLNEFPKPPKFMPNEGGQCMNGDDWLAWGCWKNWGHWGKNDCIGWHVGKVGNGHGGTIGGQAGNDWNGVGQCGKHWVIAEKFATNGCKALLLLLLVFGLLLLVSFFVFDLPEPIFFIVK